LSRVTPVGVHKQQEIHLLRIKAVFTVVAMVLVSPSPRITTRQARKPLARTMSRKALRQLLRKSGVDTLCETNPISTCG
jgi:homoserine kinase